MPSVVRNTPLEMCEIIVADNCSTDDSLSFLMANYPQIRVIENTRNGGYAGGYNDALKHVDADYYVLLNQDVEVTSGWVETVVNRMESDANIVAAQPKLLDYYKRHLFEYAGASGGYMDMFGYAFCRGRLFDSLEEDKGQYDDVADVFWATGACLFVRSDAFWRAGALDEDFFAHQEEIDLCWRLKNLGHRVICVPQSVVYHVGGGSLPQGNPRKAYLNFRNNLFMMFKNLPLSELWWKLWIRLALDGIAAIQSVVKDGNFKTMVAIIKANLSFLLSIPLLIRKRKLIPFKQPNMLLPFSVVWQYFINGKKKFSDFR